MNDSINVAGLNLSRMNYTFAHKTAKRYDGNPCQCRQNGKIQTWKRNPARFRIPVKFGLTMCFYIQNFDDGKGKNNSGDWVVLD